MSRILEGVQDAADVLVLGGDLTNLGLPEEGEALLEALAAVPLPVVAVLGNHDHESGRAGGSSPSCCREGGVNCWTAPPGSSDGVGFAGVKGFGAGFAPHRLSAFGEAAIKQFVEVAVRRGRRPRARAGRPRHPAPRRRPALLADRGDARGRAAGDLPLPRRLAARGGARPARGRRRRARARARRARSRASPTAASACSTSRARCSGAAEAAPSYVTFDVPAGG